MNTHPASHPVAADFLPVVADAATGPHGTEPSPASHAGFSIFAAAILAQRDAIAERRRKALLRADCREAARLEAEARELTNEILRRD